MVKSRQVSHNNIVAICLERIWIQPLLWLEKHKERGTLFKAKQQEKIHLKKKILGEKKKANDVHVVVDEDVVDIQVPEPTSELLEIDFQVPEPIPEPLETASTSKIVDIEVDEVDSSLPESTLANISGYRLMDMAILAEVFLMLSCPECHGTKSLQLHDVCEKKRGLARYLQLNCSSCLYVNEFCTSKTVQRTQRGKGRNMYEINIRSVYGFRQIGSGYDHLKKLCCIFKKAFKCLHGKTQNSNESYNGMIWNRVPKAHHVGLQTEIRCV